MLLAQLVMKLTCAFISCPSNSVFFLWCGGSAIKLSNPEHLIVYWCILYGTPILLPCTMWVASPWEFSEMTIQPARHECHACCPLQAEKPRIQPVVGNTHGTHYSCRAGCIVISENPQGLATHLVQAALNFQKCCCVFLSASVTGIFRHCEQRKVVLMHKIYRWNKIRSMRFCLCRVVLPIVPFSQLAALQFATPSRNTIVGQIRMMRCCCFLKWRSL